MFVLLSLTFSFRRRLWKQTLLLFCISSLYWQASAPYGQSLLFVLRDNYPMPISPWRRRPIHQTVFVPTEDAAFPICNPVLGILGDFC